MFAAPGNASYVSQCIALLPIAILAKNSIKRSAHKSSSLDAFCPWVCVVSARVVRVLVMCISMRCQAEKAACSPHYRPGTGATCGLGLGGSRPGWLHQSSVLSYSL